MEKHSRPGEAKGQHGGWGSMAGVWAGGTEQTQWAYGIGQAGLHPKSSRHPCGPVALTMESAHGPEPLQSGRRVCPNQDHVGSQEEVPQGSYNTSTAPHTVSKCSPTPRSLPPGSVLLHLTCLYPPLRDPSFFLLGQPRLGGHLLSASLAGLLPWAASPSLPQCPHHSVPGAPKAWPAAGAGETHIRVMTTRETLVQAHCAPSSSLAPELRQPLGGSAPDTGRPLAAEAWLLATAPTRLLSLPLIPWRGWQKSSSVRDPSWAGAALSSACFLSPSPTPA